MKISAAIFDLDGTLLDTLRDIAESVNEILVRRSFPTHPLDAYRFFAGNGVELLFERALPVAERTPELVAECVKEFLKLDGKISNHTKPFPGIVEMLEVFAEKRIALAVLSNKPDHFVKLLVRKHFPGTRFQAVQGAVQHAPKKPDPLLANQLADEFSLPIEEIIFVGDTNVDMETAVAANMFPVGVLWGFRSEEELRTSGAKAIASEPRQLLDLLLSEVEP